MGAKPDPKWQRAILLQRQILQAVNATGVRLHQISTIMERGCGITIFASYDEFRAFRDNLMDIHNCNVEVRRFTEIHSGEFIYDLWVAPI